MNIQSISCKDVLPVRHQVLWPDKPELFCKVAGDDTANHYGVYVKEKLVCVASIYITSNAARLRKFATLTEFQGLGFGSALISYIIEELKRINITLFWCDARKTAINFYQKFSMEQEGIEFTKSGILYIKMKVQLLQNNNNVNTGEK